MQSVKVGFVNKPLRLDMEGEKIRVYVKHSLAATAILLGLGFCGAIVYAVTDYYDEEETVIGKQIR